MSDQDLKRSASSSNIQDADPRPTKKAQHGDDISDADDIFNGDDSKHRHADAECSSLSHRYLPDFDMLPLELIAPQVAIIIHLVAQKAGLSPDKVVIDRAVENDPTLTEMVKSCLTTGEYKRIRNLPFLRKATVTKAPQGDEISVQYDTTVMSWTRNYVGEAHKALYDVMCSHCKKDDDSAYGRFLAVVQSSGTGKSRMVDEMSKEHLGIPINLRPESDTGFPPADPSVCSFFDEMDKGNLGELICLALLILSCDKTTKSLEDGKKKDFPLIRFIQNLLNEDASEMILTAKPSRTRTSDDNKTFKDAFNYSRMYFNHFIKIHDFRVVNRRYLWALIARGAAVLCVNYQAGLDIVLPFLYDDPKLGRRNVSAILIQVKNDRKYSTTPKHWLFDAMDPYLVGLFDHDEEEPLPVIRMVFALSSPRPAVKILKPRIPWTRRKEQTSSLSYTAYDIWCAGAFPETFGVINKGEEATYQELLKVWNTFPKAYESGIPSIEALRRSMNPGTQAVADHWIAIEGLFDEAGEEVDDVDVEMS